MALQRLTKIREDNAQSTNTFDFVVPVLTPPATTIPPERYDIIRYSSLNNRPVTVILELLS
jgi:hypothetical protein